jgi:DNA-directed RNA polymerase specialized sigma24 family protein
MFSGRSRLSRAASARSQFCYHLDLDVAGIAATLALSEGTVKTLLHRARRRLAIALGEPDEEMEP